jgi:hypothetical protein
MHKKPFCKVAALVVLLGFIFLSAPGLMSADKKATKFDFRVIIKKPAMWISSVLNMFTPIFDPGNSTSKTVAPDKSNPKIKPLGDILIVRPSRDD